MAGTREEDNIITITNIDFEMKGIEFLNSSKLIERVITKKLFDEIITVYSDDIDSDTVKIINDFSNGSRLTTNEIQHIKDNLTKILNQSYLYKNNYWSILADGFYFILGTCQMMRKQYIDAQLNFDEILQRTIYDDLYAITIYLILVSVYTRLKNDADTNKRARALHRYMDDKRLNLLIGFHPFSRYFFTMFKKQLNIDFELTEDKINHIVTEVNQLKNVFREWKENPNNNNVQKQTIIKSNYLCYLHESLKLYFFNNLILNQIDEGLQLKNIKEEALLEHYKLIANNIKEAGKYFSLSYFIKNLLTTISNNITDRYLQTCELKKVLEQLKKEKIGFSSLYDDQDLDSIIARLTPQNLIEPFAITLTKENFIARSQIIAKPILLDLNENVINAEYKKICRKLIMQFLSNKPGIDYSSKFIQLYNDCNTHITTLTKKNSFLNLTLEMEYGPVLDILYYLISMSLIDKSDDFDESFLNEAIINFSNIENVINLLRLTQAVFRLWNKDWLSLEYSLGQIKKTSAINTTSQEILDSHNEFIVLEKILHQHLADYKNKFPLFSSIKNADLEIILSQIISNIDKNEFGEALRLKEDFEKKNVKQIYRMQEVDLNLWLTILYFKWYNQSGDNKKVVKLIIYFKRVLSYTYDRPCTLLLLQCFITKIYSHDLKTYIKLFHEHYKKVALGKLYNLRFDRILNNIYEKPIFDENVSVVIKSELKKDAENTPVPIESNKIKKNISVRKTKNNKKKRYKISEGTSGKIKNKLPDTDAIEVTELIPQMNAKYRRDALTIQRMKDGKIARKAKEKEDQDQREKDKLQAAENKREKKKKQKLNRQINKEIKPVESLIKTEKPVDVVIETDELKVEPKKVNMEEKNLFPDELHVSQNILVKTFATQKNEVENADIKIKVLENKKLALLKKYFTPEDDLVWLNDLANKYMSSIFANGSFVVQLYLLELGSDNIIEPNDIDINFECAYADYKNIVSELKAKGFGNEKTNDQTYGNLKKPLKKGKILDLTLKFHSSAYQATTSPTSVTISINCCRAKLAYFKNGYIPIFIVDKDHEFFKEFDETCSTWSMRLGMPGYPVTSFAYRYDKCKHQYLGLNITNEEDALQKLFLYYKNNNVGAYLELRDFFIKNVDVINRSNTFKLVKLAFKAIFESRNILHLDVNKFVRFFVDCKNNFYYENKDAFVAQMELMIQNCLNTNLGCDMQTVIIIQLQKLKYLHQMYDLIFNSDELINSITLKLLLGNLIKCYGYNIPSPKLDYLTKLCLSLNFDNHTFFKQIEGLIHSNCDNLYQNDNTKPQERITNNMFIKFQPIQNTPTQGQQLYALPVFQYKPNGSNHG